MNRTKSLCAAAAVLSLAALPALANEEPKTMQGMPAAQPTFASLDVNKDGVIAKTEIPAENELSKQFAEYDLNADAKLTQAEFDNYLSVDEEEEAE